MTGKEILMLFLSFCVAGVIGFCAGADWAEPAPPVRTCGDGFFREISKSAIEGKERDTIIAEAFGDDIVRLADSLYEGEHELIVTLRATANTVPCF